MRLPFARMYTPGGLMISVDGVRDGPALLIKVGGGTLECDGLSLLLVGSEELKLDFVEVQVTIFGAAWSIGRE